MKTTTSNGAGLYDFSNLHIGTYNLYTDAKGFNSAQTNGIVMNVASTVQQNVTLTVGAGVQTVTVEADAMHLQTETNEVSTLITGQQITQLATNGRNMVSLTTLGTGVSNNLGSFNGVTAQGSGFGLSFNGMRPDHNDWLIDGGEAYDRGSGGKFDLMPSPDALAEFQTLSSNYSPDYGIASGGTVTMAVKSGSKSFHGALWEFIRNDAFDAANYFAKRNNSPTPELRLNIFGGNIGGPAFIPGIYPKARSKTFFFVNEEWRRFINGVNPSPANTVPASNFPTPGADLVYTPWGKSTTPVVPVTSDPAKLAIYAQDGLTPGQPFPGNKIPANLLDPNAVLFMQTGNIPKPNTGTADNPQYIASPKQPTYVREDVVRIDHDLSQKMHLMGHWMHDQMSQTIIPTMWSGDSYDTIGDVFQNPSWSSVIQLSQTLSPNQLNETSLDVNGNTIDISPISAGGASYVQPQGWNAGSFFQDNNALNRLPQVSFGAPLGTTWTEIYWPWHNSFLDYQIRDDLTWNHGKHSFKAGFSYMRIDKNQQLQADTQGDYSFGTDFSGDSYLNFLLGFADSYSQLQSLNTEHWLNNTYSFYGLDNWHVTPRLTLNLGLRWDLLPHAYEKNNEVANFVPGDYDPAAAAVLDNSGAICTATSTGCPAVSPALSTFIGGTFYLNGIQLAGQNGFPRGIVKNNYFTLQPRIGIAWEVFSSDKTVLRAGFGQFFERIQGNDIYGAATNPPFAYLPSANAVYFSSPTTSAITGGTAATPTFPASMQSLSYYYPNPATAQYSLGIQQQVAPSVIFVMQYVGSTGWNQSDERNINTLPLGDIADRQAVATGLTNANLHRPFLGYSGITQIESATNQNYNSFQTSFRWDNKHNLTMQFSYTWSHEIAIQSGALGSTNLAGSGGTVSNPFNLRYDRGSGVLDRRHNINASN